MSPGACTALNDQSDVQYSNFAILYQKGWNATKKHHAVDIMEFCGGESRTTILLKRRSVQAGENFDIRLGHDMLNNDHIAGMWRYVMEAKPSVSSHRHPAQDWQDGQL